MGLRLGVSASQVYGLLSALTPIRETLLFSFLRNTKYLIEYTLLKKEKNSFRNDLLHSYERTFKCVSQSGPVAIHSLLF